MIAVDAKPNEALKQKVREFWNAASCGEVYAAGDDLRARLDEQGRRRYELEPYIPGMARFVEGTGKDVLEIGVGMGADHLEWAKARPKSLTGIDLTDRAVEFTRARLTAYGFEPNVMAADAENLPFADGSFDIVYSWGVLHHSPDTPRAIREVIRVLRPGGIARVMIYHRYGLVGYMLWTRYALLKGRPGTSLEEIYAKHLESPGTKAYTVEEAREMFAGCTRVHPSVSLAFGDLLEGGVGQRHRSALLGAAKAMWPRWFIRRFMRSWGTQLFVEAVK